MSMTRLEAEERARAVWGDMVAQVERDLFARPGERYTVHLHDQSWHRLDGNGHTDCHDECAALEQVTL